MDLVTKVLLTGAIAIMSYFFACFCLGLLMKTWHAEIVGENEVLTEACENHARDKQSLVLFPALFAFAAAGSFYLFWYQYLPR